MSCNLCKEIKESTLWIQEYKFWNFGICPNQHRLGSLVIILKKHKENFSEMSEEEILELRKIVQDAQKILDAEFKPDWYNVQQNGNWEHHLHFHVIPRYKEKRKFQNKEYVDSTFGQPVTYTPEMESKEFLQKMTLSLKKHL